MLLESSGCDRLCLKTDTVQHYLDGDSLPEKELGKAGEDERTKKNLAAMKATQMAVFKRLAQFQK